MQKQYFNSCQLKLLICLVILVNLCGMFYPILRNDDPPLYANIAKHIVLSGDWLDLISQQHDWLDKPHFPFWLTAVSFKIFGINSFAYILPGFLFHILGAYYTYRLAKILYDSSDVGLIAAVIYLSALHLLMSSIDVRAEAYLLGEIMGACFYWYRYNKVSGIKLGYLLPGAGFTALAMMTKGIFVLITITSGVLCIWGYTKNIVNILKPKWLIALVLSFILISPEIYALYSQFDLHPEKIIYGHTHVSGIKWFFWDSQFGRFFNTGPIAIVKGQDWHYIFFIHTFLWAFLPWSIIFFYVMWYNIKFLGTKNMLHSSEKEASYYLLGSFIPTFILFSVTRFQLDHYTNIIMPFAAILCARWLYQCRAKQHIVRHPVFYFQIWLSYLLTFLVVVLSILIFDHEWLLIIPGAGLLMLLLFILFTQRDDLTKAILYPVMAIGLVFIFMLQINRIYAGYDLGYQVALYLNKQQPQPVVDYKVHSLTLEFYTKYDYLRLENIKQVSATPKPYYLLITTADMSQVKSKITTSRVIKTFAATTIDRVVANLLTKPRLQDSLTNYLLLEVK